MTGHIPSFPFPSCEAHLTAWQPFCLQILSSFGGVPGTVTWRGRVGETLWWQTGWEPDTGGVPTRTSVWGGNLLSCGWFKSESSGPWPLSFTSALETLDAYQLGCEIGRHGSTTGSAVCVHVVGQESCVRFHCPGGLWRIGSPLARGSHPHLVSLPAPGYCFRGQPAFRLEWVTGRRVLSGCKANTLSPWSCFCDIVGLEMT